MGKNEQMRAFMAHHGGEFFTATELARELGWYSIKERVHLELDGKYRKTEQICYNSTAAKRIAKKCGARVVRVGHVEDGTRSLEIRIPRHIN